MTLRTYKLVLPLLTAVAFIGANSVSAQTNWDTYKHGTLQEIIEQHFNVAKKSRGPLFSGDLFPTKAQLIYRGRLRQIEKDRREFIDNFFKSVKRSDLALLFKSEALFTEGKQEYWLPFQEELVGSLREEFANSSQTVFVNWIGCDNRQGKLEWFFLGNSFGRPEDLDGSLEFSVLPSERTVKKSGTIQARLNFKNVSEEPIFLFKHFGFGPAGFSLELRASDGSWVDPTAVRDNFNKHPPYSPTDFIEVAPHSTFSVDLPVSFVFFKILKPGIYDLKIRYANPIPKEFGPTGVSLWGGSEVSVTTRIKITL